MTRFRDRVLAVSKLILFAL